MRNIYPVLRQLKYYLFLPLFLSVVSTAIAHQKITGVITNSANLPMAGVTVEIKNRYIGATTDITGHFTIMAKPRDMLIVSFIGYQTLEIKIGSQHILNLSLSELTINLDEIFLTGYTFQKLKEITGSVVNSKDKRSCSSSGRPGGADDAGKLPV